MVSKHNGASAAISSLVRFPKQSSALKIYQIHRLSFQNGVQILIQKTGFYPQN